MSAADVKAELPVKSPKNLQNVRYWLVRIWCQKISNELCRKLANSIPKRIRDVLRRKGQHTKY
jgi:hypothetical protein